MQVIKWHKKRSINPMQDTLNWYTNLSISNNGHFVPPVPGYREIYRNPSNRSSRTTERQCRNGIYDLQCQEVRSSPALGAKLVHQKSVLQVLLHGEDDGDVVGLRLERAEGHVGVGVKTVRRLLTVFPKVVGGTQTMVA